MVGKLTLHEVQLFAQVAGAFAECIELLPKANLTPVDKMLTDLFLEMQYSKMLGCEGHPWRGILYHTILTEIAACKRWLLGYTPTYKVVSVKPPLVLPFGLHDYDTEKTRAVEKGVVTNGRTVACS